MLFNSSAKNQSRCMEIGVGGFCISQGFAAPEPCGHSKKRSPMVSCERKQFGGCPKPQSVSQV